ncbi:Serine/threonine-protein kinase plk1, partial [Spiromyces aspiralis]
LFVNADGSSVPLYILHPRRRDVKYKVLELLGSGAFGRCYRVCDVGTPMGGEWACKVLNKADMRSIKIQERLRHEIRVMKALPPHPNLVQYRHSFEDNERVYIVMELCSKETLMSLLKRRQCLTEFEARYFAWQLVEGIAAMHQCRLIHRDIKFANILLDHKNRVKIADFGLSAKLESDADRKRSFLGTPNFLAPEIITRSECGHSFEVDVWAIGVVIYAMLIGKTPFRVEGQKFRANQLYSKICNEDITFPYGCELSTDVRHLILALCNKSVENRPPSREILAHPWFDRHKHTIPRAMPPDIFKVPIRTVDLAESIGFRPVVPVKSMLRPQIRALQEKDVNIICSANSQPRVSAAVKGDPENVVVSTAAMSLRASSRLASRLAPATRSNAVKHDAAAETRNKASAHAPDARVLRSRRRLIDTGQAKMDDVKISAANDIPDAVKNGPGMPTPPQSNTSAAEPPEALPLIPSKPGPLPSVVGHFEDYESQQPAAKRLTLQRSKSSLIKGSAKWRPATTLAVDTTNGAPTQEALQQQSSVTNSTAPMSLFEIWETRLDVFMALAKEEMNRGSKSDYYCKPSNPKKSKKQPDATTLVYNPHSDIASYISLKDGKTHTRQTNSSKASESLRKKWTIMQQLNEVLRNKLADACFSLSSEDTQEADSKPEECQESTILPSSPSRPGNSDRKPLVYLLKMVRTENISMFRLSNNAIQFNFKDRSKLLLFDDHRVCYVSKDLRSSQFDLHSDIGHIVHDDVNAGTHLLTRLRCARQTIANARKSVEAMTK